MLSQNKFPKQNRVLLIVADAVMWTRCALHADDEILRRASSIEM